MKFLCPSTRGIQNTERQHFFWHKWSTVTVVGKPFNLYSHWQDSWFVPIFILLVNWLVFPRVKTRDVLSHQEEKEEGRINSGPSSATRIARFVETHRDLPVKSVPRSAGRLTSQEPVRSPTSQRSVNRNEETKTWKSGPVLNDCSQVFGRHSITT